MNNNQKTKTLSTITFIGITCALVASIRNIPNVATAGYTMFIYMLIAVVLFALPITLISGELSSMYEGEHGGMETWVTNILGKRWGFVTSWLLWVQMFPGMVMISAALSPLIGTIFGDPALGENKYFSFGVILVIYWLVTILNLLFDMTKINGKIGVWIGLYVPFILFTIIGIIATIKTGINSTSSLGSFNTAKFFGVDDIKTTQYITAIMFIFTGIEMSSVHVNRLKNPVKDYIIGVMFALVFMLVLNTLNGFMVANAVTGPTSNIQNNNISQGLALFDKTLGIPNFLVIIFCILVVVGVLIQLSAWAGGPSKTIISSARRGLYPPKFKFWKINKHGESTSVLITQAVIITIFAIFYLLIPGVQSAFLVLVYATSIIYSLAYVLMAISLVRARIKNKDIKRPFKIGKTWLAITIVVVFIFTIVASTVLTVAFTQGIGAKIAILAIPLVLFIVPIILYKFHNPDWVDVINAQISKDPTQAISRED